MKSLKKPTLSTSALLLMTVLMTLGCEHKAVTDVADTILHNGKVYSLSWGEPDREGVPAPDAPYQEGKWSPDGEAVAIKDGNIILVGSQSEVMELKGENTELLDAKGGFIFPGFVDAHSHVHELGELVWGVDLTGAKDEAEAVERIVAYARDRNIPKGEWILGRGWDEGDWADNLPNEKKLTELFPDNPVFMNGATGFGVWGNKMAMEKAGFDRNTPDPPKGKWMRYENGELRGVALDAVVGLWRAAIPPQTVKQRKEVMEAAMLELAGAGIVMTHHAGTDSLTMNSLEALDKEDRMPIRIYAMLDRREPELLDKWEEKGPTVFPSNKLFVQSLKGGLDGTIGVRSARLIEEYSDRPGHFGVDGDYMNTIAVMDRMIQAGFQVNIHAIGDRANRDSLEFYERNFEVNPDLIKLRHRIEHASIIHPDDYAKFADLEVIASVQPPYVAEDPPFAVDRIGMERSRDMYAWRKMRRLDIPLAFGSDLVAYEYNIFYGIYAATTRMSKEGVPEGGFFPEEKLTSEESLRGYTNWAAYSAFLEEKTGTLEKGKWADIVVTDIDILNVGQDNPKDLLNGKVLMTMVGGKTAYKRD